jgi:GNAT superfamily N-acetyltransferase
MIRSASSGDLSVLLALGAEHAAFEHLPHWAPARAAALASALDGDPPQLHAWIANVGGQDVGYASATLDFSTLDAAVYLHMDCLYVRENWRGHGVGLALWSAVHSHAREHQCAAIQWQTPPWNEDAARFYRRLGATEATKQRYGLPLGCD